MYLVQKHPVVFFLSTLYANLEKISTSFEIVHELFKPGLDMFMEKVK